MSKNSKKGKKAHLPKNAQGVAFEDIKGLRLKMKAAAEAHGEDAVAKQVRHSSYSNAFASITNDMGRNEHGFINNRLDKMMKPKKVKTNKYRPHGNKQIPDGFA